MEEQGASDEWETNARYLIELKTLNYLCWNIAKKLYVSEGDVKIICEPRVPAPLSPLCLTPVSFIGILIRIPLLFYVYRPLYGLAEGRKFQSQTSKSWMASLLSRIGCRRSDVKCLCLFRCSYDVLCVLDTIFYIHNISQMPRITIQKYSKPKT